MLEMTLNMIPVSLFSSIKLNLSSLVFFYNSNLPYLPLIIAVTIFFPYENEAYIPLLVSIAIWIGLAIVNRILRPNVVKVLNIWETGLYFAGAWVKYI